MLATIRDIAGQGDAALYIRLRDAGGRFFDFSNGTWKADEDVSCRTFLSEQDDSDTKESRYSVEFDPPEADGVVEYVRIATAAVIGEDTLAALAQGGATGTPYTWAGAGVGDARGHFQTAGDIINRAAAEMGLGEADDPWASSDPNFVQLRRLLQSVGEEILRASDWQHLRRECSFQTVVGQAQYFLPDDFHKMIPQTGWVRSTYLPMQGPLTSQQWQYVGVSGEAGALPLSVMFRLSSLDIRVTPTPSSPQTVSFEYLSQYWVQSGSAAGPDKATTSATADLVLFDALLVVAALKAKFLAAKGFDNSVAVADRDAALASAKGRDGSATILSVASRRVGYRLLDELNAPLRIGGI